MVRLPYMKRLDQRGMASIIVTMIMMIVISLIVLGLGDVTRHNERETLDNQLATQAYYAAETGINDALNKLKAGYRPTPTDATNCTSFATSTIGGAHAIPMTLNGTTDVAYTCLLVNDHPGSLSVAVKQSSATVLRINPSATTGLTFSWNLAGGATNPVSNCSGTLAAPATGTGAWDCPYPVLRMDIYDDNGDYANANAMASQTAAVFFVPNNGGGTSLAVSGDKTYIAKAACSNAKCTGTITGWTAGGAFQANHDYYARLSSIYDDAGTVTVAGSVPNTVFSNSQIVIDATGRAQDQLKRLRQVFDFTTNNALPVNTVSSEGAICKVFRVGDDTVDLGNGNGLPDIDPGDCNGGTIPTGPPTNGLSPIVGSSGHAPGFAGWSVGYINTTDPIESGSISTCFWDMGDDPSNGPIGGFNNGYSATSSCQPGDQQHYQFFHTAAQEATLATNLCYNNYRVKLTTVFNDGSSAVTAYPARKPSPNNGHLCP